MDTTLFELAITILAAVGGGGAVVVALAAWLGKLWSDRISLSRKYAGEIDLDLRKRRVEVYGELWKYTALLPKWPRAEDVTYEQLRALSQNLRKWYFDVGGMYLSRTVHDKAYGPLQDTIAEVLGAGGSGPLSAADYENVRRKCSALRSQLAADIESRRDSPL